MATVAHFLLPILLFAVVSSAVAAAGQKESGRATEAAALREFKRALVDVDGRLSSWDDAASPCGWAGIACSVAREVTGVTLHGLGLGGALSPAVCALPRLAVLNVSKNALSGPVPAGLAACAALEVLDLSTNSLHGAIPPELCALPSLRRLFLSENLLTGEIDLCIFRSS